MIRISEKTLKDLEFHTILSHIVDLCNTDYGKTKALQIVPLSTKEKLHISLQQVSEYKSSYLNDSKIPNHGFDSIDKELQLLGIENTFLETFNLKKIISISITTNDLLSFFRKFKELYPVLHETSSQVPFTKEVINCIEIVVDKFGEIKDNASPTLSILRKDIQEVQGKLNGSFGRDLTRYNSFGYLDDIKESVVDNRRVLAVKAMYRRKVKGAIMGNSKTGSIVYIEPEATLQFSRTLSNLQYEEREEIVKILKDLTNKIRPFSELLTQYQEYLSNIDIVAAKTKYANKFNGVLPKITEDRELTIKDAYHPLLYLNNQEKGEKTYPQTISLDKNNRIIVISGPNAGGKSITLKTVGLLQIMLQSGMLIPVHEYSRMSLFNTILTDIGDNQSIENHLSTYSYRLKNMNYFLRKCNDKTLFLIDEFGTGSDPELGGALAEAFLEVFYERESFGIITTHYANLKMLANELPNMTNANMLFDSKTLEPLFKLYLGEAGSSFTFEVAQKNGIPYSLINKAKKKVERGKIRFDKSIANLQKERSKLQKTTSSLKTKEQKTEDEKERLDKINKKLQNKLESYQELYDSNQRMIYLGQKLNEISEKYFHNKKKRELIDEFMKIVQVENSKRTKQTTKQRRAKKAKEERVVKEVEKKVEVIREKKKELKKKEEKLEKEKPKVVLKIGDRVRMIDGKSIGTIDILEKGKAVVNYGIFTTNVAIDQLEFVERKK
ncbi:DNA mismatch repair protein MutS2 [Aquimarina amphilecti]|uniref:DNA mismatch repair protein MutS2 n=1 Tax=Aquimarina amphilecti TaxID=1038014 RepID=A0A1H7HVB7_AQUAM|nr:DNA mismatch repair protein MutS [Aquimarina amphilecti]SEK54303.1 DNA mismatch repair protein MutS2 [Aquimarina amphilecti]